MAAPTTDNPIDPAGPALRSPLRQAVEAGNMVRFSELITPLKVSHPDLAAGLGHPAENFNYSKILSLLKQDGQDDRQ